MNIEIANRLVQLRKAHGLSQEELAAKLGLSRQAVSKWERAESSPDTDNLIMLSRLYGVSLDALLATDDPLPEPEPEAKAEEPEEGPKQSVRVSFTDGINVTDDDGSRVHIGWDGIYVNENGESDEREERDPFINDYINDIEVDGDGVSFTENGERVHREWNSEKDGKRRYVHKEQSAKTGKWRTTVVDEDGRRVVVDTDSEPKVNDNGEVSHGINLGGFPYAVLVTGVFLLLGFLKGWWHPAWLLFLTIPIYYPIASAIRRRRLLVLDIAVPVLVTGAYVALGLIYKAWHPLWLMLLAIPLYFAISSLARSGLVTRERFTAAYAITVAAAYLALGFAFGRTAWLVGWLLFLTVPMFSSIAKSVRKHAGRRWLVRFPWELLIAGGYLFAGLMWGIWHPTWVAFLLIPVLRWIVSAIAGEHNAELHIGGDDDDDDDDDFIDED